MKYASLLLLFAASTSFAAEREIRCSAVAGAQSSIARLEMKFDSHPVGEIRIQSAGEKAMGPSAYVGRPTISPNNGEEVFSWGATLPAERGDVSSYEVVLVKKTDANWVLRTNLISQADYDSPSMSTIVSETPMSCTEIDRRARAGSSDDRAERCAEDPYHCEF